VIARADGREGLVLHTDELAADELLHGVARRYGARVRAAGRTIVADGAGVQLRADRHRIEQALDNLVDNALSHGAGTIRLRAAIHDGRAELHVRDDGGPGFPDAFLAQAFDRFTRADPARSRGGSGLGLAIVQAVARAHGGEAGAANAADGGADVWLSLPR
jgi:signal transduction histidine kinase